MNTTVTFFSVLLAGGWLAGGHIADFTPASLGLMAYMALLSALAFSIWSVLLKHDPVGRVTIFNFLIPVFGVALSAVFLGEDVLAWKNGVALVLVCVGIGLVTVEKRPIYPQASPRAEGLRQRIVVADR